MLHHIVVWDSADLDKDKGEEWVHLMPIHVTLLKPV